MGRLSKVGGRSYLERFDRALLLVLGTAAVAIGLLMLVDTSANDEVWGHVAGHQVWPWLLAAGGVVNIAYAGWPSAKLREWAGSLLPVALIGRGLALIMGIMDETVASVPRAVGALLLWVSFGVLFAAIHFIYLPMPEPRGLRSRAR